MITLPFLSVPFLPPWWWLWAQSAKTVSSHQLKNRPRISKSLLPGLGSTDENVDVFGVMWSNLLQTLKPNCTVEAICSRGLNPRPLCSAFSRHRLSWFFIWIPSLSHLFWACLSSHRPCDIGSGVLLPATLPYSSQHSCHRYLRSYWEAGFLLRAALERSLSHWEIFIWAI